MEKTELVCVNCPMGCRVTVEFNDAKEIQKIYGNNCPRGKAYAEQESIRPMRILTTTVKVNNGLYRVIPVITTGDIPLDMMKEAMDYIRTLSFEAPINVEDVLVENFLDTGVNLVASRSMKHK